MRTSPDMAFMLSNLWKYAHMIAFMDPAWASCLAWPQWSRYESGGGLQRRSWVVLPHSDTTFLLFIGSGWDRRLYPTLWMSGLSNAMSSVRGHDRLGIPLSAVMWPTFDTDG